MHHTNTFTLVLTHTYSMYLRVMYACIASNLIIHINRDGSIMCVRVCAYTFLNIINWIIYVSII